ncbi:MAG: hypothetical protein Q7V63_08130 [Gammaproteobacteria bacterium]|nr:hypothetical protein [Gammaproteobacteria bacterium]
MDMTFLLGMMGIIQAVFLPGFILLRLSKIKHGFLRGLVLAFALSLIFNYVLILGLAWFHHYTPTVIRSLFSLEVILALCLAWQDTTKPFYTGQFFGDIKHFYREQCLNTEHSLSFFKASFFLTLLVFVLTFILFIKSLGGVFVDSDALVMWSVWAAEWSMNNGFSTETWHYAQLLPINYSLPYVMIGESAIKLQFFATAIAHLFPVVAMLTIIDFIMARKKALYLLAIPLLMLFYSRDLNGLFNGCADVPVSVMGFIALYVLLLAKEESQTLGYLILGSILCAGSAVTKQPGLYLCMFYPLLAYIVVLKDNKGLSSSKKFFIILCQYALMGIIVLPWYLHTQWLIDHGYESSELSFITSGIYGNISPIHRIWPAWTHQVGIVWLGLGLSLVALCKVKECRALVLIALPYFMLWSMFACYDNRNLALILPWLALTGSAGAYCLSGNPSLQRYFASSKNWVLKLKHISWRAIMLVFIGGILLATILCPMKCLVNKELRLEQQLGGAPAATFYSYQRLVGFQGKIASDWQYLGYLPGLSQYFYFNSLTVASINQDRNKPEILYFATFKANPEVYNYLTQLTLEKALEIVAISADGNTVIYKIIRRDSLTKSK